MNGITMKDKYMTREFAFSSSRNMIRDKTRRTPSHTRIAAAAGKVIKAVEYFRCRKMLPITTIKRDVRDVRDAYVSISDIGGEK